MIRNSWELSLAVSVLSLLPLPCCSWESLLHFFVARTRRRIALRVLQPLITLN